MNKNFYVFLDIDGVMYDLSYIKDRIKSGDIKNGRIISKYKPESVCALNMLIENLSKYYNVHLVITSTLRFKFYRMLNILEENGINIPQFIGRTSLTLNRHNRGGNIARYLQSRGYDRAVDDFVIIDDEKFNYHKYFDKKNIIKTSIINNALSINAVKRYCNTLFESQQKNL